MPTHWRYWAQDTEGTSCFSCCVSGQRWGLNRFLIQCVFFPFLVIIVLKSSGLWRSIGDDIFMMSIIFRILSMEFGANWFATFFSFLFFSFEIVFLVWSFEPFDIVLKHGEGQFFGILWNHVWSLRKCRKKKKKPRERKPLLVYIIQHLTSDPLSRTSYKIPELSFLFLSFLSKQSQHECINSIKICFAGLMIWSCSILSWNFLIFSKFFPRECFL